VPPSPIIGLAKAAASAAGLEVHRSGYSRTWSTLFARMMRLGLNPGTVIDAGVARGTPDLHQAFPQAHLLLIEPVNEYELTYSAS
jgi:hypothetical protein